MFVLGEIFGIEEAGAVFRAAALFLAVLLPAACGGLGAESLSFLPFPFLKKQRSCTGEGQRPGARSLGFAALLILLFLLGTVRAFLASASFHTEAAEAFFERYVPRNPGEFDYGLYLKSLSIASEEALSRYRNGGLLASGLPYFSQLGALRSLCAELLTELFSEKDAGILRALLLGDRSAMDEDVRQLYQSQGIAHLLAVSGLHLSIIGMGFYKLVRRAGAGTGLSGLVSGFLVISYGVFTGSAGSALRAVCMLLIRFLSIRLGRSYDTLSALSLSAFLLAFARPYLLLSSGFQLSFGAILAICFGEAVCHACEKERAFHLEAETGKGQVRKHLRGLRITKAGRLPSVLKTLLTGLSIQLFTLPIILTHYFTFPLYAFFLNLLVIPLMGAVVGSGLLALFFGLLSHGCAVLCEFPFVPGAESFQTGAAVLPFLKTLLETLAKGAGGAAHYILAFYEYLCGRTAGLPLSSLAPGQPSAFRLLLFTAGLSLLFAGFWSSRGRSCALQAKKNSSFWGKGFGPFSGFVRKGSHRTEGRKRTGAGKLAAFFAGWGFLCFVSFLQPHQTGLTVTAIDVGQGDGFLIQGGGRAFLIDGGSTSEKELGKYTLRPVLLSQGITQLNGVFVSHSDADHISGLLYLLEEAPEIRVERLFLPKAAKADESYGELKRLFLSQGGGTGSGEGPGIFYLEEGMRLQLSEGASLSCLYAGREQAPEANMHSPVMLLRYGAFSMLFTGDMTKGDEALFAKAFRRQKAEETAKEKAAGEGMRTGEGNSLPGGLTVYKAAHHGSKTSNTDAVLKLFYPRYALFSYEAGNSYGHPHREVTERFQRYGTELLKTGESGAITLWTDGERLRIRRFLE